MSLFAKGILCSFIIPRRQINNLDHEEHSNIQIEYLHNDNYKSKLKKKNKQKYKVRT